MNKEYTLEEVKNYIKMASDMYGLVRLVDPEESRELVPVGDKIEFGKPCHDVWTCSHRCENCSSLKACRSRIRIEKQELFRGKVFNIQSNPVTVLTPDGSRYDCVMELINNRPATEEDKERLKDKEVTDQGLSLYFHDPLTGLYNKDGFAHAIRNYLNETANVKDHEYLMIYTRLNQFKLMQDLFGKAKANEVLLEISHVLNNMFAENRIVAYVDTGALAVFERKDIFDQKDIKLVGEKVRSHFADTNFRINTGTGIYVVKDIMLPVETMLDRAEMALGTVPDNDRDGLRYFDDSMLEELLHKQRVIGQFDEALANSEFKIFLQPQVNDERKIVGAEALARWIKADGTIIPPFKFIPILEESGLIGQMDINIWEQAAAKLKAWEGTEKENLYISINISPLDFYYIDVVSNIKAIVEKYNIDKKKLRLEITETALMRNEAKDLEDVNALRREGFVVEIDDFGKGYSSLSMLKNIEADVLKIDMNFLTRSGDSERGSKIIKTVIELAGKLDMEVITEGVETEEQFTGLLKDGCFMFQGYFFAKPVPVDEFESLAGKEKL